MHAVMNLIANWFVKYMLKYSLSICTIHWTDSHCQWKHNKVTMRYCNAETPTATATCRPFVARSAS